MRLSEFIEQHHKKIMEEWVAFARTHLPWSNGMNDKELRDHGEELLTAIVSDMESPQSSHEQSEKSKGRATEGALGTVGHKHATERLKTGFKIDQLVAEYRALRASFDFGGRRTVTNTGKSLDSTRRSTKPLRRQRFATRKKRITPRSNSWTSWATIFATPLPR